MKVYEHCSDRKVAVNMRRELEIAPLDEYGRHVDPDDGAICAYVPVDKNDNLRVTTTFNGTVCGFTPIARSVAGTVSRPD